MGGYTFEQLLDVEQIRQLLESHHRLSGMAYGVVDLADKVLLAVGWQEICTRFHRTHPLSEVHCRASNALIREELIDGGGDFVETRCKNGMIDVAMPIRSEGRYLATFFVGQFFYEDDPPDPAYFRAQGTALDFDLPSYLKALDQVPVFSRTYVRDNLSFLQGVMEMLAECALRRRKLSVEMERRRQLEIDLKASRDFLTNVIDAIADPILVKDRQHRFVLLNAASCALFGHPREALLGRSDYEFFPKEQADEFWSKDELVFRSGDVNLNEGPITDAHGQTRYLQTKKTPFVTADGRELLVGVIRDITERKAMERHLQQTRTRLLSIIQTMPDLMWLKDVNGTYLACNHAFERFFGATEAEIVGKTDHDFVEKELADFFRLKDRKAVEAGQMRINEEWITFADDGYRALLETRKVPVRDGDRRIIGVLGIGRDITERKRSEESLRLKQEQLAAMAVELTLAEERERLRIASVLHDHIGQTLLLGRIRLGGLDDASIPTDVQETIAATRDLLDQVGHDIHSLTVQLSPPILEVAGLEAALEWLGKRMATDYGLQVEFQDDRSDKPLTKELRVLLYQCAWELLINVAKHAQVNRARLSVHRQGNRCHLRIEDDGVGFDSAALVPDGTRECRFGLFSVQLKVKHLGGEVAIDAAPGKGCRITVSVPVAAPDFMEGGA